MRKNNKRKNIDYLSQMTSKSGSGKFISKNFKLINNFN